MSDTSDDPQERVTAWARQMVDAAVQAFMDRGISDGVLLEAKPAWAFPPEALIAMVREQGERGSFYWVICGEGFPFDYVKSTAAQNARDAARHFAMKWHLDAARLADGSSEDSAGRKSRSDDLASRAEALFRLVNEDSIWQGLPSR